MLVSSRVHIQQKNLEKDSLYRLLFHALKWLSELMFFGSFRHTINFFNKNLRYWWCFESMSLVVLRLRVALDICLITHSKIYEQNAQISPNVVSQTRVLEFCLAPAHLHSLFLEQLPGGCHVPSDDTFSRGFPKFCLVFLANRICACHLCLRNLRTSDMKPDEIKEARHCDGEMVRWWDEEEYVGNKQNGQTTQ